MDQDKNIIEESKNSQISQEESENDNNIISVEKAEDLIDYGQLLYSWEFNEFEEHQRGSAWYIISGLFILAIAIYCVIERNYLFLVIIIMIAVLEIMTKFKTPSKLMFAIYEDGIEYAGKFFYKWEDISEYYIIYEPENKVKKIYFKFNKITTPSLRIDLGRANPLEIRDILNRYTKENLERKHEHLSDQVERMFKL